jgi:hypothetical protein
MHVLNHTKMHIYGQALAVSALALSKGRLSTVYLLVFIQKILLTFLPKQAILTRGSTVLGHPPSLAFPDTGFFSRKLKHRRIKTVKWRRHLKVRFDDHRRVRRVVLHHVFLVLRQLDCHDVT